MMTKLSDLEKVRLSWLRQQLNGAVFVSFRDYVYFHAAHKDIDATKEYERVYGVSS